MRLIGTHSGWGALLSLFVASVCVAEPYSFVGLNVGVSQPTNDNYNAHAHTGAVVSPYGGYMFTENFGLQGDVYATFQPPDDDNRGVRNESDTSTLLGFTAGPRLALPIGQRTEFHVAGGLGFFSGLSGRLTQSDWGFSVGAGLDYFVAPRVALTAFGRWNGAAIAPVPHFLPPRLLSGQAQNPEDQGPKDIRWATGGIGIRYDFRPAPKLVIPPAVARLPYEPPSAPVRLPPPPPTEVRLPPPAPVAPPRVVLHGVTFAHDSAVIEATSSLRLRAAATSLRELGWPRVEVQGHTDSRGSEAHNLRLSQRRAEAVRANLVERGVPAASLRATGYGESRPVASNDSEAGRQENRRVELLIEGDAVPRRSGGY